MDIEETKIGNIIPYARNPRIIKNAVPKVASSIREYGFRQPIVVDESMTVVVGHVRLEAAKLLNMETVPVHIARNLTPQQIKAYRIADNRAGEEAGWDDALLALEVQDLQSEGFDPELTGLDVAEIDSILSAIVAEEANIETQELPDAPPVNRTGDVWQLGNHRLICGDALEEESYARLLTGTSVNLLCTDPPYNVAYQGKAGGIDNDDMDSGKFAGFIENAMRRCFAVMSSGAAAYVFYSDKEAERIYRAFRLSGFKQSGNLIWKKNHFVLGRADYHGIHEPCLYGYKPGKKRQWHGGRKQATVSDYSDSLPFVKQADGAYQLNVDGYHLIIEGDNLSIRSLEADILEYNKPNKSDLHPTMKPPELIARLIMNSSKRGQIVLDPFGGSGTALIACEQHGRHARLIEKEPKFCDVIIRRWQEITGDHALNTVTGMNFGA